MAEPSLSRTPSRPAGWLRRLFAGRRAASLRESVEERLDASRQAPGAAAGDTLVATERAMLVNLLKFGTLRVDDVMVPRADIVAVEEATPLADAVELLRRAGHSRLPVYRETLDDPIGMIHVRDLLDHWGEATPGPPLAGLARQVLFVPPSMPVLALLVRMRSSRTHMALVVDEYGGIHGLATIEDLVEPIVGEIWDEHDAGGGPLLAERGGGIIDAHARAPVEELERMTGCHLLGDDRDEDIDTVGGLVYATIGRIPARGEVIAHAAGLEFEVVDADPRRIKRLRVRRAPRRG